MEVSDMEDNMTKIDVSAVEERKAQWKKLVTSLEERGRALHNELTSVQAQLAQLSGAIQACDVLLAGDEAQPEVSTANNDSK